MEAHGLLSLLSEIEAAVPSNFPPNSWYLIVASALAALGRGDTYGDLYSYLTKSLDMAENVDARQSVSRRLREVIIKSWTLIGMPRAISASYALQAVDATGDESITHNRADVAAQGDLALQRAEDWFSKAFAEDEGRIFAGFKAHREMDWTLRHVVYGLYLADLTYVSPVENEFIVLACVMCTGGPRSPTLSHLKVLRRLGLSSSDTAAFQHICELIAEWAGVDASKWPRAHEIEPFNST